MAKDMKFARCPRCDSVIRYKEGEESVSCPRCKAVIKLKK